MLTSFKLILTAALVLSIIIPFGYFAISEKKKGNFKIAVVSNAVLFFGTIVIADVLMFSGKAFAAPEAAAVASSAEGWKYLGAALSTGLSCIGGGIAVASAASAALGALSEDQTIMGKALIFVALAEGIALYGLLISLVMLFK